MEAREASGVSMGRSMAATSLNTHHSTHPMRPPSVSLDCATECCRICRVGMQALKTLYHYAALAGVCLWSQLAMGAQHGPDRPRPVVGCPTLATLDGHAERDFGLVFKNSTSWANSSVLVFEYRSVPLLKKLSSSQSLTLP